MLLLRYSPLLPLLDELLSSIFIEIQIAHSK